MTLRELLGVEIPLIQAPMAGSQASALAIAVTNAGALGSLACAALSAEALQSELTTIAQNGTRPVNLNFFCHAVPVPDRTREAAWRSSLAHYYGAFGIDESTIVTGPGRMPFDAQTAALIEPFRPRVVSFHFGLPEASLLARVKQLGAKVLASATTVEEARWLEAHGADAIIAQGAEAGGHRGMFLAEALTSQLGTFALVPQVVSAVKLPVIAAGGIADVQGIRAALALGAAGVQLGTTFLLCPEATTSAVHRAALKSQEARHTAFTNLFTGRPARGIVNRFVREHGPLRSDVPAFPLATAAIAPLREHSERQGSGDFSPLWAGQNVSGCRELPAAELVRELAQAFTSAP